MDVRIGPISEKASFHIHKYQWHNYIFVAPAKVVIYRAPLPAIKLHESRCARTRGRDVPQIAL